MYDNHDFLQAHSLLNGYFDASITFSARCSFHSSNLASDVCSLRHAFTVHPCVWRGGVRERAGIRWSRDHQVILHDDDVDRNKDKGTHALCLLSARHLSTTIIPCSLAQSANAAMAPWHCDRACMASSSRRCYLCAAGQGDVDGNGGGFSDGVSVCVESSPLDK